MERFFYTCTRFNIIDLIDVLSCTPLEYLRILNVSKLRKYVEIKIDEKIYKMYIEQIPFMLNKISFEEYKKLFFIPPHIDKNAEIEKAKKEIHEAKKILGGR
ncbi:MAG: hypothetical protein RR878_05330 [Anaerorhabdus sp.]|uniref:hypothetical protein n=1 Tax=Anaerorhabdus sp. TaxID=1872524 RepID=UPI002FC9D496